MHNEQLLINQITAAFFDLFTNTQQRTVDLERVYDVCLREAIIIKKSRDGEEIYNLDSFISPRKKILTDGTLREFEEWEVSEETRVAGNLAQRFSRYHKKGFMNGQFFEGKGNKFFQYVKTIQGWKISAVAWEDEPL